MACNRTDINHPSLPSSLLFIQPCRGTDPDLLEVELHYTLPEVFGEVAQGPPLEQITRVVHQNVYRTKLTSSCRNKRSCSLASGYVSFDSDRLTSAIRDRAAPFLGAFAVAPVIDRHCRPAVSQRYCCGTANPRAPA